MCERCHPNHASRRVSLLNFNSFRYANSGVDQVPLPIDSSTSLATWHTLAPALDPFSNPPSLPSVSSTPTAKGKVKANCSTGTTLKQQEVAASSQGRDKWVDPDCDLLPPTILSWKLAMEHADKAPTRVHGSVSVGTWFPDPCLIGTASEDRRKRYLVTWLSIRSAWLNRITAPQLHQSTPGCGVVFLTPFSTLSRSSVDPVPPLASSMMPWICLARNS